MHMPVYVKITAAPRYYTPCLVLLGIVSLLGIIRRHAHACLCEDYRRTTISHSMPGIVSLLGIIRRHAHACLCEEYRLTTILHATPSWYC